MSALHRVVLALLGLLWLGLGYLVLDRGGVTLYNILVVLIAGGLIILPLYKKWTRKQ